MAQGEARFLECNISGIVAPFSLIDAHSVLVELIRVAQAGVLPAFLLAEFQGKVESLQRL